MECGKYSAVGSRCVQPVGHDGQHQSQYGAKWTDESAQRTAAWMADQMTGWD